MKQFICTNILERDKVYVELFIVSLYTTIKPNISCIQVLFGVFAVALALPVPDPDDCEFNLIAPAPVAYGAAGPLTYGAAGHLTYGAAGPLTYGAAGPLTYGAAPHVHLPHAPVTYGAAAPVAYGAAAPVAYAAPTPVHVSHAEVQIPVTQTHVEVPVHQQVHYGTQSYVAGTSTSIHKPSLVAPAIAPPSTLLSKITHNAPEVTIQHQEVPVEKHIPNFVDAPYHAGTVIKYSAPEVKEVKVHTPVAVPHVVPVPHPVGVPTPVHTLTVHKAPAVVPAVAPAVQYTAIAPAVIPAADADDC